MSLIIVQVGQCGNQVGQNLFETVHNDCLFSKSKINDTNYIDESLDRFFYKTKDDKLESRAVQIDMEEKVISNNVNKGTKWRYCDRSKYTQKQGSGNNWANGYCHNGEGVIDKMDELMRLQFERADSVDGVLVTMSVAGGTGSGVGTRICRYLRENYPEKTLVSHLVWPYSRGEVCVQSYNAVLSSLSVDAMLFHENDLLHDVCLNRLSLPNIGVNHLNDLICHQLASILQPVHETKISLSEMVLRTVIHPDYRLLKIRNAPYMADKCHEFTSDRWPQLLKQLKQMMKSNSVMEEGLDWGASVDERRCAYISGLVVARGGGSDSVGGLASVLGEENIYSRMFPGRDKLSVWTQRRPFRQYEKSVVVLTNGKDSVSALDLACGRAWKMFKTDAFLYQYEKYGLHRSYFLDCFANTEQMVHNYASL